VQRRLVTIGVVAAVVGSLSGCGGSSSSNQTATFKTSFQSAVNQLRDTSQAIGTAIKQAPSQTDA
jgi:outer membrane murein-binding lipoprotein Lpp